MDYLITKADGTATKLYGKVGKVKLPNKTKDIVFTGDKRPLDLGDYLLVEAVEITEAINEKTQKRGDTSVVVDSGSVTVTHTSISKTSKEIMAEIRAKRDALLLETDWWGASDNTMSSAQTAYRLALRNYPATYTADNSSAFPELGE